MRKYLTLCPCFLGAALASAQQIPDLKIGNETIQFHAFASQSFLDSDENNFLTIDTKGGSFGLTDFGFNASMQVNDKLRIGAQLYDYHAGELGNWRPELDWAMADYRWRDWLGFRAGKVKTPLGLFNDTQDMEFLQTWALMPQSTYPLDLRGQFISHVGGDVYGHLGLKKLGAFDYTGYAGEIFDDPNGGYVRGIYEITDLTPGVTGVNINTFRIGVEGGDVRWTTPVKGLMTGASLMLQNWDLSETETIEGFPVPLKATLPRNHLAAYYAQYSFRNLTFNGEYRRHISLSDVSIGGVQLIEPGIGNVVDGRDAFVSGAYRINKRFEVGTYHSWDYYDWSLSHSAPDNHILDQVFTLRTDLTSLLDLKIEEHLMRGYGSQFSFHGFYPLENLTGLKPDTNMFVVRMGFHI